MSETTYVYLPGLSEESKLRLALTLIEEQVNQATSWSVFAEYVGRVLEQGLADQDVLDGIVDFLSWGTETQVARS